MKTKTISTFLIITILMIMNASAQDRTFQLDSKAVKLIGKVTVECIYQYTTQSAPYPTEGTPTSTQKIANHYQTILQCNATTSKFFDYHTFQKDSIIYTSSPKLSTDSLNKLNIQYNYKVRNFFETTIFKNYPQGKISVTDVLIPNDYLYEEPLSELRWELSDDTLSICGYICNKATTEYSGRQWTAWYAPEIAISEGPWKLFGLPGLILKAEESKGEHSFEAIGIRKSDRPIYFTENYTRIKADKEQFISQKNKFEAHREPLKKTNMSISSIIAYREAGIFLVNGKRVKIKKATIDVPLELE